MIARDLCTISDHEIEKRLTEPGLFVQRTRSGTDYATRHLHSARDFAQWAASDGRGFAHLIG